MLLIENILKDNWYYGININFAYSIGKILRYNPIVESYDSIQNFIILDLDLVWYYLHSNKDET